MRRRTEQMMQGIALVVIWVLGQVAALLALLFAWIEERLRDWFEEMKGE